MKESKLIEMQKRQEILGNAVNRMLSDLENIKTLCVGNMELIKLIPGYDEALEEMRKKQEEPK